MVTVPVFPGFSRFFGFPPGFSEGRRATVLGLPDQAKYV